MRSVLSVAIIALMALSANAASVNKRDITPNVQLCIDALNTVSPQLAIVKTDVDAFVRTKGYGGALIIHSKGLTLANRINSAATACCIDTGVPITDDDATAVLGVVTTMTPNIVNTLASVVAKKPEFDAVPPATSIVSGDITLLDSATDTLISCLLSRTPSAYLADANALNTSINDAFDDAVDAYV